MNEDQPTTALFYSTIRSWGWGAPDYVWPRAAQILRARGIRVLACVRPEIRELPPLQRLQEQGVEFIPQPPLLHTHGRLGRLRSKLMRWDSRAREFLRAMRSTDRPHVFIDQGGTFDFLSEDLLQQGLQESRSTYDVFFRSTGYQEKLNALQRERARSFLQNAQRCLFNSRWTRQVTELHLLESLNNAHYFKHLVRFEHTAPLPWPAAKVARLACVNRLDKHHKGLDVLLEGLSRLDASTPPWTLDIYGKGPDSDYLQALINWLGLQDRVTMHPHVDDVRDVWRRCHLLLLTSRYEGLAVAMLEAMACGRPVLRTPYGGAAEWIKDNQNGYVCPAPEPALIAQSIAHALANFSAWQRMGSQAHQDIQNGLPDDPESVYLQPFVAT